MDANERQADYLRKTLKCVFTRLRVMSKDGLGDAQKRWLGHTIDIAEHALEQAVEADKRKHTPDFGKFKVERAAIPGKTILIFRRKREHDPATGSVTPGRIIVADIHKADVGLPVVKFIVKSYMAGEKPRVIFSGDMWVCLSKVEKIVYKMVKEELKQTHRRREMRKRRALYAYAEKAAHMTVEDAEDAK